MQGYCVKCKAQQEITNPKQEVLRNGRGAVKGICPQCGTHIFKMGAKLD